MDRFLHTDRVGHGGMGGTYPSPPDGLVPLPPRAGGYKRNEQYKVPPVIALGLLTC
jgi:hypothetical protein